MTKVIGVFSGNALGIWICGCSLFYKREGWVAKSEGTKASKSAGAKGDVPKIYMQVCPLGSLFSMYFVGQTKCNCLQMKRGALRT